MAKPQSKPLPFRSAGVSLAPGKAALSRRWVGGGASLAETIARVPHSNFFLEGEGLNTSAEVIYG